MSCGSVLRTWRATRSTVSALTSRRPSTARTSPASAWLPASSPTAMLRSSASARSRSANGPAGSFDRGSATHLGCASCLPVIGSLPANIAWHCSSRAIPARLKAGQEDYWIRQIAVARQVLAPGLGDLPDPVVLLARLQPGRRQHQPAPSSMAPGLTLAPLVQPYCALRSGDLRVRGAAMKTVLSVSMQVEELRLSCGGS